MERTRLMGGDIKLEKVLLTLFVINAGRQQLDVNEMRSNAEEKSRSHLSTFSV